MIDYPEAQGKRCAPRLTILTKIGQHGGIVNRPIFDFPGGSRFHFIEPSSNEFAVWSETAGK